MRCHRNVFILISIVFVSIFAGCKNSPKESPSQASSKLSVSICTSSPYLQAAMTDLLGEDHRISTLLAMAGAGMCPGHMDLRPGQIQAAQNSSVFVRFDFQAGLDEKLFSSADSRPTIKPISVRGGLCNPETYVSACEQAARILIDTRCLPENITTQRLDDLRGRLLRLTQEVRHQMAESKLIGTPILASPHQADFCRFLGLDVRDTFTNEENMSVRRIDQIVSKSRENHIALIVANAPEGRKMADVLASYLNARVVVFENFPQDCETSGAFDKMVLENVRRLMEK